MAITILYGPGGSGKSYLQAMIIERELLSTQRNICTNLSLDLGKLNAYMERKYPNRSTHPLDRIRILTTEETWEFWKYRGPTRISLMDGPVESMGERGCVFIIDEAGVSGFSAQQWAQKTMNSTRGIDCCWYLDQQRKFSDDVYASCNGRTPSSIAKGFREKAHAFVRLKNGYQSSFGPFRGRSRLYAYHFAQEPGPNVDHIRKETWEIDPNGIGSVYRTQDGVGVVGLASADIGKRAKGISIMWAFPIFIGVASLCGIVPWLLGKGVSKAVTKGGNVSKTVSHASDAFTGNQPKLDSAIIPGAVPMSRHIEERKVVGVATWGKHFQIMMSDGEMLSEDSDARVSYISPNKVVINGKDFLFSSGKVTTEERTENRERERNAGQVVLH